MYFLNESWSLVVFLKKWHALRQCREKGVFSPIVDMKPLLAGYFSLRLQKQH